MINILKFQKEIHQHKHYFITNYKKIKIYFAEEKVSIYKKINNTYNLFFNFNSY